MNIFNDLILNIKDIILNDDFVYYKINNNCIILENENEIENEKYIENCIKIIKNDRLDGIVIKNIIITDKMFDSIFNKLILIDDFKILKIINCRCNINKLFHYKFKELEELHIKDNLINIDKFINYIKNVRKFILEIDEFINKKQLQKIFTHKKLRSICFGTNKISDKMLLNIYHLLLKNDKLEEFGILTKDMCLNGKDLKGIVDILDNNVKIKKVYIKLRSKKIDSFLIKNGIYNNNYIKLRRYIQKQKKIKISRTY
jgi:hypothetical protein